VSHVDVGHINVQIEELLLDLHTSFCPSKCFVCATPPIPIRDYDQTFTVGRPYCVVVEDLAKYFFSR